MKPLNVLLIHRDSDNYRRLTGWWSYDVPEFTWHSQKVTPFGFKIKPDVTGYDLIVLDDWIFGRVDKQGVPMAYVTVDSARSPEQLRRNREQATQADLVLVDCDDLRKFDGLGIPARRFAYAVNERLYYPDEKRFDVAFLCWPTPERRAVRNEVEAICKRHNWTFLNGTYPNPYDYVRALCSAKIVVHKQHVAEARSWRVFDVMAAQGCLLSNKIPLIDGDGLIPGKHYHEYTEANLEGQLSMLMDGMWQDTAFLGWEHVIQNHTWSIRATQLRELLNQELGL